MVVKLGTVAEVAIAITQSSQWDGWMASMSEDSSASDNSGLEESVSVPELPDTSSQSEERVPLPDFVGGKNGQVIPVPRLPDPQALDLDEQMEELGWVSPTNPNENYHRPGTGESARPDDSGHGPHWDWQVRHQGQGLKKGMRIFPDNTWEPK
jgi:hypothetical protein